jgi:hypothetical protein
MAMGDPDGTDIETELLDRIKDARHVPAGIDDHGLLHVIIPDQRAVLGKRRDRHDAHLHFAHQGRSAIGTKRRSSGPV